MVEKILVYVDDHVIRVQDNDCYTPLRCACHLDCSDIVKTLMLAEADEAIIDFVWLNAAQETEKRRRSEPLKLLDKETL